MSGNGLELPEVLPVPQCGFACAHFSRQQNKTTFPIQAILQMGNGLAVVITGVEKARIGHNRERFSNQAKMLEINTHSAKLLG